ncbi:hypothetical protein GALL_251270 [mine drainage metagenome]|uniref:DUF2788 domain-containing protein n=1 Tax=mine drainage metagenome TaxID=410659 RepID=A0A1J5RA29_9ZZZZ
MSGYSEAQVSGFFLTYGVGAFMVFMLFIVGELAYKAKAGKTGTLVLFFVLSFGMVGFVVKEVLQSLWRI